MRVILIHGFNATHEDNFYPWLKDQLGDLGFEVVVPHLSLKTGEDLDMQKIIDEMKDQIGFLKSDDIILGHSLGALIALQYLEAVEMIETPRAFMFVATPWNVSRPELRSLFIFDLDADVLMWKAREFVVVHSKDDKMVPIEHGRKLAEVFKARLVETEKDDHYMGKEYPMLLNEIKRIADTPFKYSPGESLSDDYKNVSILDRIGSDTEGEETPEV